MMTCQNPCEEIRWSFGAYNDQISLEAAKCLAECDKGLTTY